MNLIEITNKLIEKCRIRTYSELDFFRGVLKEWNKWNAERFHGIYPVDPYLSLCHAVFDNLLEILDMEETAMVEDTFNFTVLFLERYMYREPMKVAGVELNNILK